jgi:uncharacterized membrane protein HdeD (DUF308 family)
MAPLRQQPPGDAAEWSAGPPSEAWNSAEAAVRAPHRGAMIVAGVLSLGAGLVAIAVPALASVGTAVFIGLVLLVASVALFLGAWAARGLRQRLLGILIAVLTLLAGLYLLVSPLEGTFTLTVMLVIWFVGVGIARVAAGVVQLGIPGAGYTIAAGAASLLLGLLIARELPSAADWAIGMLVGIDFLVYGVLCLGGGLRIGT